MKFVRTLVSIPQIKFNIGEGIPGLFSPQGLEIAWFKYQLYLVKEINKYLENNNKHNITDLKHLATSLQRSPEPMDRQILAKTSMALTNEFFFEALRPSKNSDMIRLVDTNKVYNRIPKLDLQAEKHNLPPPPQTPTTTQHISNVSGLLYNRASFGSASAFRETFVDRGDALLGQGAVWLLKSENSAVMNSYGWATPLIPPNPEDNTDTLDFDMIVGRNARIVPVLCANLFEQVYLHDYGVKGRRQFLENVMDCIDWDVVEERMSVTRM